ncbi:hypothetical protein BS47DRAFT_1351598 [Hydnum rufescens UP504]|uniref:FAD-binding FR-type domain-containing protein n=1 Tax=Hydnum rufescens UP504 TaxID=1448309 RepID=A0A9P6AKD9_9AGAM|nr:hypothetical protein BS47DRAFT_1351598 [Hydnum rufescens UP504]
MSLENPTPPSGTSGITNTYVVDPQFARRFTAGWVGLAGVFVVLSAPRLYRSIRSGRAWQGLGIYEKFGGYEPLSEKREEKTPKPPSRTDRTIGILHALVRGPTLYSVPKTQINMGEVLIIIVYYAILLLCLLLQANLRINSNRGGFMALAQLPAVFLFGTKNNPLSFLLGRGYEKLNVIHRWSGGQASFLKTSKPQYGMAAYGTLCALTLLSLRPVRQKLYQFFFITHVMNAILESCDTSMTLVHIPDVTGGWIAGQHVQLRVFFGHRIYESHSFTIINAPPAITNLPTISNGGTHYGGITLAARVAGDWTRDLNTLAQNGEKGRQQVVVLLDGPYGGSSLDFGEYEAVLLISGGSGVTVSLGILDDLLGRIVRLGRPNRERTKRIDVVWCIRSFGAILWFAPMFMALGKAAEDSSVDLSFKFYVTCLCDPEAIPPIPNCTVSISKPTISESLQPLLTHAASTAGGTQNAVAKIGPMTAASVGGIGLHTELFAL